MHNVNIHITHANSYNEAKQKCSYQALSTNKPIASQDVAHQFGWTATGISRTVALTEKQIHETHTLSHAHSYITVRL